MENSKSKCADELLIRKIQDLIARVDRGMTKGYTDFLDPRQQILITRYFSNHKYIKMESMGYNSCRKICGF